MSEKKITIRMETKDDYSAVENLTRESFWNVYRPGCMEHYVLHRYRDDPAFVPELDFVMELDGELIGQVIYVRSEIDCDDGRKVPIMTFGPLGIVPAYKAAGATGSNCWTIPWKKRRKWVQGCWPSPVISCLRQVRLRPGKDKGRALCRRPGGGLFSHQGADARLFGRHLRHL